jgi:hypothetical protein
MRGPVSSSVGGHESKSGYAVVKSGLGVLAVAAVTALVFGVGGISPAVALPSFARQTGQPCGACHTEFPGLTPYGRRFKLGGYTYGGGPYRTTLFPSVFDQARELTGAVGQKAAATSSADKQATRTSDVWMPPI